LTLQFSIPQSGKPRNIRLLDFQLCRYAAPVNDLLYFIFTSTNEELRAEHYDDLLKIYHTTLTTFLTRLGSDAPNIYRWTDFQDQLRKFGRFGLVMAIMLVQLIVAEAQDLPDMDQVANDMANNKDIDMLQGSNEKTDRVYNKRMRGVINDIVRLGYY
jgi:Ecdysteroid kinase-like family